VGVVVIALQGYAAFVVLVMIVFAIRHWYFTMNRLWSPQRPYYQDLFDTNLPHITVVVPMHNEAAVATSVIDALLDSTYPKDRLEILPFDDQSRDDTSAILHEYYERYPEIVKPVYMLGGLRGKPNALNVALRLATHDIILVFDADYTPGKDILRALTTAFSDPEVGAVMGRVIPMNSGKNFLTRLLSLERSGGYQVDQQARYNLDLIPQYGGTVGGFRRSMVTSIGGFDLSTLAEDTDLTARLFIEGRKVVYSNGSECYEEVPESWPARFRQLRRWSRGHNRAFFRNVPGIVQSTHLNFVQKLDGLLLLSVYLVPPLLLLGFVANALLFFMGALPLWSAVGVVFFVVAFNSFGNFAPVYEIGAAELIDGAGRRLLLLPYLYYLFLFNSWAVTHGLIDTLGDLMKQRSPHWDKTARFRDSST
jgi:cellulose synthase/poly-beta-1,6-N-acetylglucosamine synthase-like glycosyltransferase